MPEVITATPLPFAFASLQQDPAWRVLRAKMDNWIQAEVVRHENMPEESEQEIARARRQKMRIKHFKEMVGNIDQFIAATVANKKNPKYRK